jgi:hypothetical protein
MSDEETCGGGAATKHTNFRRVPVARNECASTTAPSAYESLVNSVTNACFENDDDGCCCGGDDALCSIGEVRVFLVGWLVVV